MANINRDLDKTQEVTKDEVTEFGVYLSDTSINTAMKAVEVVGKSVSQVTVSVTDELVTQGDLTAEQGDVVKEGIKIVQEFSDEQLSSCADQGAWNLHNLLFSKAFANISRAPCQFSFVDKNGLKVDINLTSEEARESQALKSDDPDEIQVAGKGKLAISVIKWAIKKFYTHSLKKKVANKIPKDWGTGKANNKGAGYRWQKHGSKGGETVRVDKGNPNSPFPSQRVDHVRVNSGGKPIGRDGKPINGSVSNNPKATHIPLSEYKKWGSWNKP